MKKHLFIIILVISAASCNYRFFVDKDRVYNTRTGYLLFFNQRKFFFPSKSITGNDFFVTNINRPGYLVEFDKEENVLYHIAEKYVIDYELQHQGKNIFVRDTIKILPVEIGSLPYKYKSKRGLGDFNIKYGDRLYKLEYFNTNNEAVWSVYPILKDDVREAGQYYN